MLYGKFKKVRIGADTTFKMQRQILTDEIEDEEFLESAIENFSKMMERIVQGNLNIRKHRDITGEMWFEEDSILIIFDFSQTNL